MKILFVIFLFATILSAQTWVEQRTFVSEGQATPRIDGLLTQGIKGKLGAFTWFQVQSGYSQAYGGLTYSPKPWLELAVGPGLEQAKNPARVGGFVWIGNRQASVLFIPEYGGSGFWCKVEANYQLTKKVGVGLLSERFKGTGPRLESAIRHLPIKVWAAPLFEKHRVNGLFGIRYVFK